MTIEIENPTPAVPDYPVDAFEHFTLAVIAQVAELAQAHGGSFAGEGSFADGTPYSLTVHVRTRGQQ